MENPHTTGQMGGTLGLAVDRLDRALAALEARVQALNNGEPLPEYAAPAVGEGNEDLQRVLAELQTVRAEKDQLAAAANDAFEALGAAAANIRILLRDEAA